jgi:hypothetical protein
MKKTLLIVLAILVMATLVVAQDSTTLPTTAAANTTWFNADGKAGHVSHGCMLCHAPHSANGTISSAPVTPVGTFNPAQYPTGYTGPNPITSIVTGNSGGPVAGSIYLWGTALTAQSYTTWEGTTISQANITSGKNSAVVHTLLCMSCHDNANSSYSMGMGYGKAPGTEYGTGNSVTDAYGDHIGLSQVNTTGTGWSIGSSLVNTHPVDVPYVSGVAAGNWLINPDGTFQDTTFNMDGTHTGHPAKLWVDGSTNVAMVECTSCHDPHRETVFAYWNGTGYTIGAPGSTIFYLRGPYANPEAGNGNFNANFCRSCHYEKSAMYAANSGGAK